MAIFYCILLIVILFLTFMEIITWPANAAGVLHGNVNSHIAHVVVYLIMFISICLLLCNELYSM